ncbi:MAG: NfeD family protein [Planctomycetaceae bacterium]
MPGRPLAFWSLVGALGILAPTTLISAFRYWPETAIGKRALLEGPAPEDVIPFERQASRHELLVGRFGRTVTVLNPAGIALIDGSRVHCQSEGMIIPEGTPIRVVGARHNNVTVRESSSADETTPLPSAKGATPEVPEKSGRDGGVDSDLDFPWADFPGRLLALWSFPPSSIVHERHPCVRPDPAGRVVWWGVGAGPDRSDSAVSVHPVLFAVDSVPDDEGGRFVH